MKIQITRGVGIRGVGYPPGDIVDVDETDAQIVIRLGKAIRYVEPSPPVEPELEPVVEPQPEPEIETEPLAEPEPEPVVEPQPEPEIETEPLAEPEPEPVGPEPLPDPEPPVSAGKKK
jgi:hypothetical protein